MGSFTNLTLSTTPEFDGIFVSPTTTGIIKIITDKSIAGARNGTINSPTYTFGSESSFFKLAPDFTTTYNFACTGMQGESYPCYGKLYINNILVQDLKNTSATGTIKSGDTYRFSAQSVNSVNVGAMISFSTVYI